MERERPSDYVTDENSEFLRDGQYPALSPEQALICTSCIYCTRRFRFALEYFYHFVMAQQCREKVTNKQH